MHYDKPLSSKGSHWENSLWELSKDDSLKNFNVLNALNGLAACHRSQRVKAKANEAFLWGVPSPVSGKDKG